MRNLDLLGSPPPPSILPDSPAGCGDHVPGWSMDALRDIATAEVAGRQILIRADLDVPMIEGRIADIARIRRFAPTIERLLARGARVVVMSHLGHPHGEANPVFSTRALAGPLSSLIGRPVRHVGECVGGLAEEATGGLGPGEVALLENLGFHEREMLDDKSFALKLSVHGDLYVNDAFASLNRAQASCHAIARHMPAHAGPLLLCEREALLGALGNPRRPLAALVGGPALSGEADLVSALVRKVDHLILGGGLANTFLAALGRPIGRSPHEPSALALARRLMRQAAEHGCRIHLPEDLVCAKSTFATAGTHIVASDAIPPDMMALDAGPATREAISALLKSCATLIWHGPLGTHEVPPFDRATLELARLAAELTDQGRLVTLAGGREAIASLDAAGVTSRFSHVSDGGAAYRAWLEGRNLPGLDVLAITSPKLEEA